MITADLANGYNKHVCAFPGSAIDNKSHGCNLLIRDNKAVLFTGAQDIINLMGWEKKDKNQKPGPRELFIELNEEEKIIVSLLKDQGSMHVDEMRLRSGLQVSTMAAAILSLELKGVLASRPGKQYCLI